MTASSWLRDVVLDLFLALKLVSRVSWQRNVTAWIYVPFGVILILLACYGVDSLISLGSVSFPASVACMILLFAGLCLCDLVIGDKRTRAVTSVIEIPTSFALRYINIFFTPSFVLLPLSPPISGVEVGKIIGVFLIGFVVMMAVTAYMARAIQLLLGSSKRAMTERAEELGNENDNIPMTGLQESRNANNQSVGTLRSQSVVDIDQPIPSEVNSTADLLAPPRTQDPSQVRNSAGPPVDNGNLHEIPRISSLRQSLLPLTRSQRWAAFINGNIDRLVYLILFIFIGLPIYYTTSYAMPAQITFSILTYFAALALPSNWKKVLHPVLVSSFLSVIGFWIIGLIRGNSLTESLGDYKTGTRYIQLWDGEKGLQAPGAGDVFGTVLDASIVALALPMFQYRKELKQHFFAIFIPNITCSIAVLFGYPPICYAIGISSGRSLAFAVRSLTLALAKPAAVNLGGDSNTVAAICIMSGIFGALIGPKILQWLRIPEDDYVTRGVTLGGNSSAIATALLLLSDPRAAALSSLSMSLFGIITVVLTSVPPVVTVIRFLVGL